MPPIRLSIDLGLSHNVDRGPSDESLGYFRKSLRDKDLDGVGTKVLVKYLNQTVATGCLLELRQRSLV
jgi:hypothetical protein